MHVDGAYGALAALAIPDAFKGIGQADSLSLDPHKWLYQPAGVGCLLYRDPADARRAFSHSAEYARSLTDDPIEGFAFFEESMELSRPLRALKLAFTALLRPPCLSAVDCGGFTPGAVACMRHRRRDEARTSRTRSPQCRVFPVPRL